MTDNQKQQARTLEFYPFEPGSDAAKFVERMSNYAKYVPNTELTDHDAKELARLFAVYVGESLKTQVDEHNKATTKSL